MSDARWHLAQVNIGRARGPIDGPIMAEFVARLAEINALAEQTPGFVWRLQTEDGDATAIRPYADERIMINMSVWADLESLRGYVFQSAHAAVMRRGENGSSDSREFTSPCGGFRPATGRRQRRR